MNPLSFPDWLRPPAFPDRARTRQAAMIWSLLWTGLAVSLPIMMGVRFLGPSFSAILLTDVLFAGLLFATRRGWLRLAAHTGPLIMLVLVSFILATNNEGVHDVAITVYPVVIAVAGYLAGTGALFAFTLLAIASYAALVLAEISGVTVNQFSAYTRTQDIVVFAAVAIMFALLLRLTLRYLLENLHIAESNERVLTERNFELEASQAEVQRLNSELAQGIVARTADLRAATDINEVLFNISRDINSAHNHVDLVDAIAQHLDTDEFTVTLCLFDTQDMNTASHAAIVAQRPRGQPKAIPVTDHVYPAEGARHLLSGGGHFIDDLNDPSVDIPDSLRDSLLQLGLGALMIGCLTLHTRILGFITLSLPHPQPFSPRDIRVMGVAADLAAAAVDRMRLYSEQVSVAERLRDADEVKSRFMANMSHELRTPLNAILNFTRFVSSGMLGEINEEQRDALDKTLISGKHLLSLINDVLESQMLTLYVETGVDLRQEIEAAASAGEALIEDKPVTITCEISPNLPPVTGDRRRLHQVLLNLISNACRFTAEGNVSVTAYPIGDLVQITVRDTGPGIPPEEHESIFEPFRQSKRGLIAGGGTGLGLAIARRLVEAHNGTLTVESAAGKGAAFTVSIPIDSSTLRAQVGDLEAQV
jgi:signal transduction histidine kinase